MTDEKVYAVIRNRRSVREELNRNDFLALTAMSIGYERIDRRDALRLYLLGLCYRSLNGFQLTATGRDVVSDDYVDGTCG